MSISCCTWKDSPRTLPVDFLGFVSCHHDHLIRLYEGAVQLEPMLHWEMMACNQTSSASPTHPLSLIALIALIFLIALLNQLSTWVEVVKNQLISQLKHRLGVYVACSSPKLLSWPFAFALIRCLEGKDLIVWTSQASWYCPSCYTIFWSLHWLHWCIFYSNIFIFKSLAHHLLLYSCIFWPLHSATNKLGSSLVPTINHSINL